MLQDLSPVIIAAPVRRSGTTLLQRLLCSSPDCMIFGENSAGDLNMLLNILATKEMMLKGHEAFRDQQYQDVLAGNFNDWIPDLLPGVKGYLNAMNEGFAHIASFLADQAQAAGRKRWGVKMPEWNSLLLQQFLRYIPNAQILYLVRELEDCLTSAKGIEMVVSLQEVQHFCQSWQQNIRMAKASIPAKNIHFISYENLIQHPQTLEEIESFLDIQSIDREILKVKVNTYAQDSRLVGTTIPPKELSPEEREVMKQYHLNDA